MGQEDLVPRLWGRSLDMETRLVNGFYVSEDDFDVYSDQSIVQTANVHFWVEVRVNGADWIAIEPTPGFDRPRSKYTLWQKFSAFAIGIGEWVFRNPFLVFGIIATLAALWLFRFRLLALGFLIAWWLEGLGSLRGRVISTFRLLRRKIRWLEGEKTELSVSRLCQRFESGIAEGQKSHQWSLFKRAVNQCLYSSNSDMAGKKALNSACWHIARSSTPDRHV